MNELLEIISRARVDRRIINIRVAHPITGKKYPKRTIYVLLRKYANDFFKIGAEPRMIGLVGLRGTGKTTLMWQIAEHIFNNKIPIYFLNVNDITVAGFSLYDTLQNFQKVILKKKFNELNKPIVLLFDEIHDDPDWAKILKIIYDEAKTAFIVCTGSSALLLQQTADLTRRMKIEKVYPFGFIEFIAAKSFYEKDQCIFPSKDLADKIRNALFYKSSLDESYNSIIGFQKDIAEYFNKVSECFNNKKIDLLSEYIKYYNIASFLVYKEKTTILEQVIELFKKVIYEDIPKYRQSINISYERILRLLIQLAISEEINLDSLSQKTGVNRNELENILDLLDKAEFINIFNPYGGSETRIWKNRKVFFMSPSLRLSLLYKIYGMNFPNRFEGKLYEDIVAMYLRKTLGYNVLIYAKKEGKNPDFIIETMDRPLAIEVGIGKRKTSQFSNLECRYGILVSNGIKHIDKEDNYMKMPLKWFLLI